MISTTLALSALPVTARLQVLTHTTCIVEWSDYESPADKIFLTLATASLLMPVYSRYCSTVPYFSLMCECTLLLHALLFLWCKF
jgi:hypothetical protein